MGLENNLCSKLNYILHGELEERYDVLFIILAKLLTQTACMKYVTPYNISQCSIFVVIFYILWKKNFCCCLQERLNVKDFMIK